MAHILKDGEKFSIDANGQTVVRNRAGDEIVKDGRVVSVPFFLTDSARPAAPAAPVFDARNYMPRSAVLTDTQLAQAMASHANMKQRKADAWKKPAASLADASAVEIERKKPAEYEGSAQSDAAYEQMKKRKANAWQTAKTI